MKKITTAQYRSMPWKNGAGTTIEMAVFPENAFIQNFDWRVSRAAVMINGVFSHFEGIDRSLALLKGQGMRLDIDHVVQQVDANNNIAVFSGDATTDAELLNGPITDFNLMTRRARCSHRLTHWSGDAAQGLPEGTVLVYCAQGSGKLLSNQSPVELQADETVQFSTEDQVTTYTLQPRPDSRFYCVQIFWNQS